MSKVTLLMEKVIGPVFFEDIDNLCKRHTLLSDEDITLLHEIALKIEEISKEENRDIFINCPLPDSDNTITVAAAYVENSLYNYSTIGTVINETEPAVLRTAKYGLESHNVHAKSYTSTEGNHLLQDCYPILNLKGNVIAVVTSERAMTENDFNIWNKREYKSPDYDKYPYLKNLTYVAECENDAIIVLNNDKQVVYRNDSAVNLYKNFGYIEDIFGCLYEEVSLHGLINVGPGFENSSSHSDLFCAGKYLDIKEYCYCHDYEEKVYFYIIIIHDITQEKLKEEDLVLKSVAVREAHHRVKNNLQTIYNLLDMQRRRLSNQSAKNALIEAMSRISSISSAYEILSKKGSEKVNIKNLLKKIVLNFENLIDYSEKNISIELQGDDTYTSMEIATDIALVVNELLQNIEKHAFVNRDRGKICVRVLDRPLFSEIIVSDDGVGFDNDLINSTSDGLGHQLAINIVKTKLKGQINYLSDSTGTTVAFTFKCL